MANFDDQVMGLTGLTISGSSTAPSQTELATFLNDGVIDVTNRWLLVKPQDIDNFTRESATTASNGFDTAGAKIIAVIREAGADGDTDGSTAWEPCRKVPVQMQSRVVDVDSLNYASKYNPVYIIDSNGLLNVYPTPDGTDDGYRVFYVNNSPEETDGSALEHSSSGIKWFPADKVYLVVMYASMKSLQAKMGATTITDLTITTVPPDSPSAPSFSAASVVATTAGCLGTAPTYTKPTITTRVSFNDFFESGSLNPFDDSDPGALTISVSAPTTPSDPSISSPTVGAITIAALPTAPVYTPPVITTTGSDSTTLDLTKLDTASWTAADYDFDDENIDPLKWFQLAGDFIQNEEDSELAQAQLQKISTYIQAYSVAMQSRLNTFNDQNVDFQAGIQRNLQQAQIDMQDAHKEADLTLQAALQDYTLELQLFQAEVAKYQAQVNDEVQEYNTKLQRYTTEMNTVFQAWGKTETDSLQQYTADIQNELNEFNKENVAYQSTVQEALQELQVAAAAAQKKADFDQQTQIQEYSAKIQKYQAELGVYQAEVANEVQEYTQNLQADGVGYQWLQDQYTRLKAEYDQAFMLAAPKPQQQAPQQRGRR